MEALRQRRRSESLHFSHFTCLALTLEALFCKGSAGVPLLNKNDFFLILCPVSGGTCGLSMEDEFPSLSNGSS